MIFWIRIQNNKFLILSSFQQYYIWRKLAMASFVDFFNNVKEFSYGGYCSTGANAYASVILLHLGTLVFVLNKVTNDYSWVDRVWSILPIAFASHLLYFQTHCDKIPLSLRQISMFIMILAWGIRLTYNFYRKGGYTSHGQDYRWEYIRKRFPRVLVQLLNFFFTSYYQLFLIYWFSSPIYYSSNPHFTIFDAVLILAWVMLFIGEVMADHQQFVFQTKKHEMLKQNNNSLQNLPMPYKRGFITDGLFKYSRHPNFFCQISMWWVMYLLSVSSMGMNLSGFGALLLNLLFLGSTALTELISSQKYKSYSQYKKQVPMLIPGLPKQKQKDY